MAQKKTFAQKCQFYAERFGAHPQLIDEKPNKNLGIVVILPCINEPDVIPSLQSLKNALPPQHSTVEIIVLINAGEHVGQQVIEQNKKTHLAVQQWAEAEQCQWFKCYARIVHGLNKKHAGAGWARKLAMDEAIRRFASIENPNGIIASFDADSVCQPNYFTVLEQAFAQRLLDGASIHFEHIIPDDLPDKHKTAILSYELHLRYLNQAMRWSGAPYAYHTVGSAMAVRAESYIKAGGMNRKTAGEDFYFLHKIIQLGNFCTIADTSVHPSARISDRVPFGTGAAMTDLLTGKLEEFLTYDLQAFRDVTHFFNILPSAYPEKEKPQFSIDLISEPFKTYLIQSAIDSAVADAQRNSASAKAFCKRMEQWFTAFRYIKYLNWSHQHNYEKQPVLKQAIALLNALAIKHSSNLEAVLVIYRELDKKPF